MLGLEDSFLAEGVDVLSVGQGRPTCRYCFGEYFTNMTVQFSQVLC
jgi:hypothetical protein